MTIFVGNVIGGCTPGGLQNPDAGFGYYGPNLSQINNSVAYDVDTTPNILTTLKTGLTAVYYGVEVGSRHSLFSIADEAIPSLRQTMVAVWGEDVVSGCGRIASMGDANYAGGEIGPGQFTRDDSTAQAVIQNLGKFLYGSSGLVLIYISNSVEYFGDGPQLLEGTEFVQDSLSGIGISSIILEAESIPSLTSYDGLWYVGLDVSLSEDEQDRIVEFVESGKGAFLGTENNFCCRDATIVTSSLIHRLIGYPEE